MWRSGESDFCDGSSYTFAVSNTAHGSSTLTTRARALFRDVNIETSKHRNINTFAGRVLVFVGYAGSLHHSPFPLIGPKTWQTRPARWCHSDLVWASTRHVSNMRRCVAARVAKGEGSRPRPIVRKIGVRRARQKLGHAVSGEMVRPIPPSERAPRKAKR